MTLLLAAALGQQQAPARKPLNLVVDGNSISANHYTSIGTMDKHIWRYLADLPAGSTHSCYAVSGHTWGDMIATHGAQVDAAWREGYTNVLVAWETTNSVWGLTGTVESVKADIKAYMDARLAAHPWLTVTAQTLPRGGSTSASVIQRNNDCFAIDAAVAADPGYYGFAKVAQVRTGHVEFNHDGTDPTQFSERQELWNETAFPWIHPTDAGKAIFVPDIAAEVQGFV